MTDIIDQSLGRVYSDETGARLNPEQFHVANAIGSIETTDGDRVVMETGHSFTKKSVALGPAQVSIRERCLLQGPRDESRADSPGLAAPVGPGPAAGPS